MTFSYWLWVFNFSRYDTSFLQVYSPILWLTFSLTYASFDEQIFKFIDLFVYGWCFLYLEIMTIFFYIIFMFYCFNILIDICNVLTLDFLCYMCSRNHFFLVWIFNLPTTAQIYPHCLQLLYYKATVNKCLLLDPYSVPMVNLPIPFLTYTSPF